MLRKEQNEAVWMTTLVLSRGVAVPVAVHEAKNGGNAVLSKLLQAPEVPTSTAEYSSAGKRTQILGNVLNKETTAQTMAASCHRTRCVANAC